MCSTLFGFLKYMMLVSYTPKKNKCVLLLTTVHNVDAVDATPVAKKQEIITFYNMTKDEINVVEEIAAAYSTARISNK